MAIAAVGRSGEGCDCGGHVGSVRLVHQLAERAALRSTSREGLFRGYAMIYWMTLSALPLIPNDMLPHHLRDRQALSDLIKKAIGKARRTQIGRVRAAGKRQPPYPHPPTISGLAARVPLLVERGRQPRREQFTGAVQHRIGRSRHDVGVHQLHVAHQVEVQGARLRRRR